MRAAPARTRLVPEPYGETSTWCYNASVPGPEIRVIQGQRLRVLVENGLAEETTVHWHGLRVPNAMDGVPHLTQAPVAPGETFAYEFDCLDAGTFWYHPHQRSFEQVGRGLYGPLIVTEPEPLRVDRDVTWVLDDWRLNETAEISSDFGNAHDMAHGGRIGNAVTINGQMPGTFDVRRGERIRLRLINAANARIFLLSFDHHEPIVIALDGQPVAPHIPEDGRLLLGPGMRGDIILDMVNAVGERAPIIDHFYQGREYRLVELAYADEPLRELMPDWPLALPDNPLAEPDLENSTRHEVVFNGGMMGRMIMQEMGGTMNMGEPMGASGAPGLWFLNGAAASEPQGIEPLLRLDRGRSHIISMKNATAWHHPMHLHGHAFRVISRDGRPTQHREWQDTVMMAPREQVEIALVADNPGDWMFHCHILEHQAAGMMGVITVA